MIYAFNPPEHVLTRKIQYSKKCKDGKSRNFILYFYNSNQILKQKFPYDEDYDKGFDKRTLIYDEYLFNGRLHQTRKGEGKRGVINNHFWGEISGVKTRHVSFPISKAKLEALKIPKDHIIEIQ
jgi:hypothetical protein